MRKLLALFLITNCLLYKVSAQQRLALAPLPPRVVRLDSGLVLRRPLIGLTADAYAQLRAERSTDQQVHRLDSLSLAVASAEIERQRKELANAYELLRQQKELTEKALARPAPPMLLDVNYYKGFGSGFLAGLFVGFKYLPKP